MTTADCDRPFFECAQARSGLSRVHNLHIELLDGLTKFRCQRRNPGKPLEEVQRNPFAFQNGSAVTRHGQDRGTLEEAISVGGAHGNRKAGVHLLENFRSDRDAGENNPLPLFGDDSSGGRSGLCEERVRRHIPVAEIFIDRAGDNFPEDKIRR